MATRLELQTELETILGSRNVYYRPPESLKLMYPAIVYSPIRKESIDADDKRYLGLPMYKIIVISKTPDHPAVEKLFNRQYCSHDTTYCVDNLYHDVFTLYNI